MNSVWLWQASAGWHQFADIAGHAYASSTVCAKLQIDHGLLQYPRVFAGHHPSTPPSRLGGAGLLLSPLDHHRIVDSIVSSIVRPREPTISIQWLCISASFWIYTFRSPWQRRMSCSIIWFVSLIVKLREMVWTICAKSPLSLAALLILASNAGINKLFLRGSWLANWRSINWFIGALNSLWAGVSCCSWWIAWYLWAPTWWAHPGAVPFPPHWTYLGSISVSVP